MGEGRGELTALFGFQKGSVARGKMDIFTGREGEIAANEIF